MGASRFRTFFSGLCVGAADIVPGISGGTVAFIIGIYEELLASIASINASSLKMLFTLKFSDFFRHVRWQFLCLFVLGALCSFVTLAKGFQYCLNDELYRPFLYSAFMGLVVGSVIFCAKQLSHFDVKTFCCLLLGAIAAYFLSGTDLVPNTRAPSDDLLDFWVVLCGAMAISAMLLPGISGSYILNILGMYGPVLGALVTWVDSLKGGVFDLASFRVVFSMGLGIALGAIFFARIVRYLLATYRTATIATLVGFMVGAMRSVYPFWTYEETADMRLQPLSPILPDVTSSLFAISMAFFALGISLVFLTEHLASSRKEAKELA